MLSEFFSTEFIVWWEDGGELQEYVLPLTRRKNVISLILHHAENTCKVWDKVAPGASKKIILQYKNYTAFHEKFEGWIDVN